MTLVTLELDDYLWYVDRAINSMCSIARQLGDWRVNERPDLSGANSAYALVTHCCGVMADWGGYAIAGHPVDRNRPAEFVATGTVADLLETVAAARDQLLGRPADAGVGRPSAGGAQTQGSRATVGSLPGRGRLAHLRGSRPSTWVTSS